METNIYPKSSLIFRIIAMIFRNIPKKYKLQFMGILMKKNLDDKLLPYNANGFELKEAGENELKYIGSHPESNDYEVYNDRNSKENVCYCAKYQNEIMCYIWVNFKVCGLFFGTENEIEIIELKEKQAYSYDLYTYKKFRKKGVATQLQNFTNMSLKEKGVVERFNIINPSFIGSMKISLRAGFEPQRIVYIYGINKYKKVFLGTKKTNELKIWKKNFEMAYLSKK